MGDRSPDHYRAVSDSDDVHRVDGRRRVADSADAGETDHLQRAGGRRSRAQELRVPAVGALDGRLHAAIAGSDGDRSAQPRRADDVHRGSEMTRRGAELAAVLAVSAILSVALTYPIAFKLGHSGRIDNGDGQLSIWNVAWVARTLVIDPLHVFDANIFYPHRGTLAYSENNLGAGLLAIPAYWASGGNPYAAHNTVVLLAFALTAIGTYYLVRYLTHDRRAAAVSAICFAFCPYLFAHTAHIQLLMIAGLPFCMLAFHRMADRPSRGRGAALGAAMAAQAICCGYYGVFVMLMVGFAVLTSAVMRRRRTDRAYWSAVSIGSVVALGLAGQVLLTYLSLQSEL